VGGVVVRLRPTPALAETYSGEKKPGSVRGFFAF
jgi:hypothetical protein